MSGSLKTWAKSEKGRVAIRKLREEGRKGNTAILSVPYTYKGHIVEFAFDFKRNKVYYLDSKAYSLDQAKDQYNGLYDMTEEAKSVGHLFFDDKEHDKSWSPKGGILQLAVPEQCGCNDCGAFVHHFSKLLGQGHSIGDIERSYTGRTMRRQLRIRMAKDLLQLNRNDVFTPENRYMGDNFIDFDDREDPEDDEDTSDIEFDDEENKIEDQKDDSNEERKPNKVKKSDPDNDWEEV